MFKYISPLHSGNPLKSTFVKTENPDEMQHNTRASDFFSKLVGQSDLWSKNGGSFSEMMGPSISN